ncbi:hypothetical protein ACIA5C_40140 [Actinoplanes sp. NPDC051343]|uniref:hypothetical protein n=1 Tax=Actinoplanes sp. NPDC051343 TaxID=3363906 RepID=UPI0037AFE88C
MSSRSPWKSRAALVLVLVAAPLLAGGPAAAADIPLPVEAVFPGARTSTLVVDLSASDDKAGALTVTAGGQTQKATLVPVVSSGLALALVVDDARAGAANLAAWSSAAARFSLAAPPDAQAVVVSSAAPAKVGGAPQVGPAGIVATLTQMTAHGTRDTTAALALATKQFPGTAPGRRVVVLYTGAPNAGSIGAEALSAEFRDSGTILVVVGTASGNGYWAAATEGTGGFFAPAGDPVVVPALDQVQTTLAARYLVQLATPARLPARVSVKVRTGDATFRGPADIPATAAAGQGRDDEGGPSVWWWAGGALLVVLLAAAVALPLLRPRRPVPAAAPGDPTPVRGRVAVPGAAPGRPAVPPPPPDADS